MNALNYKGFATRIEFDDQDRVIIPASPVEHEKTSFALSRCRAGGTAMEPLSVKHPDAGRHQERTQRQGTPNGGITGFMPALSKLLKAMRVFDQTPMTNCNKGRRKPPGL